VHSDAYTFRFAAVVTIVCSVLLAGAATLLKPRQEENQKLDARKNILASVNITPQKGSFSRDQINKLFAENIRELVINASGDVVEGKLPEQIDPKKDKNLLPVYERIQNDSIAAYVIPVSGKGLWSTIYAYIALQTDCDHVLGITFYRHGETPGLGGEISKKWFTDNFKGKRIRDDQGRLVSITVVKGKVAEKCTAKTAPHSVDGISGATLTGRGVTHFLKTELEKYEPFFEKVRSKEGGV